MLQAPLLPQDDASSGYASDQQHPLDSIMEHQRKQEEDEIVRLSTHIDVVQKGHICNTLPLSTSHSVETLKTETVELHPPPETDDDGCGTLKADFSSWNTNNSGQTQNILPKNDKIEKGNFSREENQFEPVRTCSICRSIETLPSQSLIRRLPSFPDDIRNYNVYEAQTTPQSCTKNHSRTLLVRKHKLQKTRRRTLSAGHISDSIIAAASKNNFKLNAEALRIPSTLDTPPTTVSSLGGAVQSPAKSYSSDIKSEKRDRGNTQTSLDSGVIPDANMTSSPLHYKVPHIISRRSLTLPALKTQPSTVKPQNDWKFSAPKGNCVTHFVKMSPKAGAIGEPNPKPT